MIEPDEVDPATWAVISGRPTSAGSPLNHPITPASNFLPGGDHWYARNEGTDPVDALEAAIAGLEGGPTVVFSSGMAAASAVLDLVGVGGTIALPTDCYHGVTALAEGGAIGGRWSVERIEPTDVASWKDSLKRVDLAWIETPSNPMLDLTDVGAVCEVSERKAVVAVDSTLATPFGSRPLELGADIVMHSATKFIGGHSDLLLGTLSTNRPDLKSRILDSRRLGGGFPGSLEVFLALRGLRTLPLRYERASASAAALAKMLLEHRAVTRVRYPGSGSMVTFELSGGDEAADRLCSTVRLLVHATSLGGVETSLERRSGHGHGSDHLPSGLIRMSVGIEVLADLWHDLDRALSDLD